MKKKLFLSTMVLSVCMIAISSCKKKDDATRTELLCNKNWMMTAATFTPTGGAAQDFYVLMQSCDKDDFMRFAVNGTYTDDEGATKCSASDPQTITDNWFWSAGETVLNLLESGDTSGYTVTVLNGSTLKGNYADGTGVFEVTFGKQ